ncbi:MAG: hypothetical protein ACLQVG_09165 [Terriglobia bacterium]
MQRRLYRAHDTEVTGIPRGIRSEALECVQLAAAFARASLLAADLIHGSPAHQGGLAGVANAPWPEASLPRQMAA